ncbi:MAG: NACHT domain-containing protein, partial [Clostridia bacterium]|nr:NACHT domain-containing protein [Clostridia bacterium]
MSNSPEEIFISYRWSDFKEENSADDKIKAIVKVIEEITGLRAFLDRNDLRSGNFKNTLPQKVKSCYVFIPIVTVNYLKFGELGGRSKDRDYCLFEYAKAVLDGKKIVPVFRCDTGNVKSPSEEDAKKAANNVLDGKCDKNDIDVLIKYLLGQNGITVDSFAEEQITKNEEKFCSVIFDTFCSSDVIPFYKDHLRMQSENLNPVRILGNFDSNELTIENSYVQLSFKRQLTKAERDEKERKKESTAPTDVPEGDLISDLTRERFAVVVGDAGQGKSSFVKRLCIELANDVQEYGLSRDLFYPLYFECQKFGSDSISSFDKLLKNLAENAGLKPAALDALIKKGKPLFIFDAMDEASPTQAENLIKAVHGHIASKYRNTYFIFTTRPGQKLVAGGDMTLDHTSNTTVRRYDVKEFDLKQRDEYIAKLAFAKETDDSLKDEFIRALDIKEKEITDYQAVSRNPFMIFALFTTCGKGKKLPETRFDAIVRVMDDVIDRDIGKNEYKYIRRENVKTVLGAVSYLLYRQRDKGEIPRADTNTFLDQAEILYGLDESDSDDRKALREYGSF